MRRKILTWTVGAMVLAMAVPAAMARRGGGPGMGGPGMGGPGMGGPGWVLAGLDLSAEQRAAIDQARQTFWGYRDALDKALDAKREALHRLWTAEQVDEAAIRSTVREMEKIRTELRLRRVDMRLAVRQVLTPAQRAEVRERAERRFQTRQQRRAWRGQRRGMRGMGPGMGGPPPCLGPAAADR